MVVTGRRRVLIETLTTKVGLLSFGQVLSAWWPPSRAAVRNARRSLQALIDCRLLVRDSVFARPVLPLDAPLARWEVGHPDPDFQALSARLQARWQERPRQVAVLLATPKAANWFGGRALGRVKRRHQAGHDLNVAAVYLHYLRHEPELAAAWVGEGLFTERDEEVVPDALLVDADGRPYRAVEFGAGYPPARLSSFHESCVAGGLPYEIW
jgi:hypothetical protein